MFGEVGTLIGQALSIVAVITGFISFQMKTAKGILLFQIITAFVFSAHYLLIGAPTAVALNMVSAAQCICYYIRNKQQSKSLLFPVIFVVVVPLAGALTWEGWHSLLIIVGLFVNAIAFSLPNPQAIRKLTLIKSPLCLLYNACVRSSGGVIFEVAVLISAVLGLVKGRKQVEKV